MLKVISLFKESSQKMQKALLTDKTTKKGAFFHDFEQFCSKSVIAIRETMIMKRSDW